jgi:prevent-host-death family protein
MITISSADFLERFGRYSRLAEREPVTIVDQGREALVLLSAGEYERLKGRDRKALYVWELPDDAVQALAWAEAPEEAARYNHELDP